MKITDWPLAERPRERLLREGPAALSDAELLAIFLRTGIPGRTAVDLARDCLAHFGGLRQLLTAEQRHFCQHKGLGSAKFAQLQAALEMARLLLDNRHRVLRFTELFRGTINGASVHPREVVKTALQHNAAAVILAHNHPSGVAEPSAADRQLTDRLKDALELVDIRVLDHLVVGDAGCVSFAERGLI
jgi:DNA repair protein RadC